MAVPCPPLARPFLFTLALGAATPVAAPTPGPGPAPVPVCASVGASIGTSVPTAQDDGARPGAADADARPLDDAERALVASAVPVAAPAGDPAVQGFEDLEPLVDWVGDARVVLLGEPTHGDGETFRDKARVIAFLNRRLGFDVLCFESGFVGGELVGADWAAALPDLAEADADTRRAAARAHLERFVFPIWTASREFEPLVDVVAASAATDRPLHLTGYDCQVTSGDAPRLLERLDAALEAAELAPAERTARARLEELLSGGGSDLGWLPESVLPGERLAPRVGAAAEGRVVHGVEAEFLHQALRSLDGNARHLRAQGRAEAHPDAPLVEVFNPRDAQGGENLRWLLEQRYPGRRIVVWLASMHALRDHGVVVTGGPLDYTGVRAAGSYLADLEGDPLRVLAFTAHGGRAGIAWGAPWDLAPAPAGSLEDVLARGGLERAFVSTRGPARPAWWDAPRVARPLGYAPFTAPWPEVVDGFWFVREQTPSRQRADAAERAALEDPVAALTARAESSRARVEQGNPYGHKGDWGPLWLRWCEVFEPDAATRARERARVLAWCAELEERPAWTWRARALEALLLEEAGEAQAALAAGEAALAAYPDVELSRPMIQSSLQHVLNAEVQRRWRLEGQEAALARLARILEEDPRLRWFHADAWLPPEVDVGHGSELRPEERRALLETLGAALGERARRRPEEAAWCAEALELARETLGGG